MTVADNIERIVYDEWRNNFRSKIRHMGPNTKQYHSLNMQVYEDGTLGTRPWLRLWPSTGMSTSTDLRSPSTDPNMMMQWRPTGTKGELWFYEINGDVWTYDLDAETWTVSDTVTTGVNPSSELGFGPHGGPFLWGADNDDNWENDGKGVAGHQHTMLPENNWCFSGDLIVSATNVVSTISWADTTDEMGSFTFYRDRIWAWHNPANSSDPDNRLYYTNAGDYSTSDAGNYIDIGAESDISYYIHGAWPVRDSLLICMTNKDWYAFTGTPEQGSLRYIGRYPIPAHGAAGAVLNNAVYFQAPYGRQIMIATPSGVDTTTLADIRPWTGDKRWTTFHDYRALSSQQEQFLCHPVVRTDADQCFFALEFANEAWGWHGYGVDSFSEGVGSSSSFGVLRDAAISPSERYMAFLTYDSAAPGSPACTNHIYTRDVMLNRPSRKTDAWSDSTEDSADGTTNTAKGGLRLAPFSPPGEEVRVRQVVVDFHYWKDDSNTYYEDPDMKAVLMDVGGTRLEVVDSFSATGLDSFEDKGFNADETIGIPTRWVFRFDLADQDFRNAVQVQLEDIMSIAIDRIVVDYEVRPDNHWAGQTGGT